MSTNLWFRNLCKETFPAVEDTLRVLYTKCREGVIQQLEERNLPTHKGPDLIARAWEKTMDAVESWSDAQVRKQTTKMVKAFPRLRRHYESMLSARITSLMDELGATVELDVELQPLEVFVHMYYMEVAAGMRDQAALMYPGIKDTKTLRQNRRELKSIVAAGLDEAVNRLLPYDEVCQQIRDLQDMADVVEEIEEDEDDADDGDGGDDGNEYPVQDVTKADLAEEATSPPPKVPAPPLEEELANLEVGAVHSEGEPTEEPVSARTSEVGPDDSASQTAGCGQAPPQTADEMAIVDAAVAEPSVLGVDADYEPEKPIRLRRKIVGSRGVPARRAGSTVSRASTHTSASGTKRIRVKEDADGAGNADAAV